MMTLKPLIRSVSIIGVGCSAFGTSFDTPALKDLSFKEYGSWAVLAALDDAGVNPRQVDPQSSFYQDFIGSIAGYPVTYIIDKDGNMVGAPLMGIVSKQEDTLMKRIDGIVGK